MWIASDDDDEGFRAMMRLLLMAPKPLSSRRLAKFL